LHYDLACCIILAFVCSGLTRLWAKGQNTILDQDLSNFHVDRYSPIMSCLQWAM